MFTLARPARSRHFDLDGQPFGRKALSSFLLSALLCCGLSSNAIATNDGISTLTLAQALEQTLASNPQLHQYTFHERGLQGQRVSSSLKPALSIGLDIENFAGSGAYTSSESAETTIALSSVLELGSSKRSARISVADARLTLLEEQQKALTLELLGKVTAVFIQALSAQQLLSLSEDALVQAKKTISIVQSRAQRGAAAEFEVKRASVALAQAEIDLYTLKNTFMRKKVQLASLFGKTTLGFSQLHGSLFHFSESLSFAELAERAKTSPAIAIFASETRLHNAQLQLARTQSKTDLSWNLGVRRFEESSESALVAGVSIPLFNGKRNKGSIKSALAARDNVQYQRQDALLKLHSVLYDAFSLREQHIYAVQRYKKNVIPNLEQALALTQKAYENGRYRYRDWIAAQTELREAKQLLIRSAAAALTNQATIEQLIGHNLMRVRHETDTTQYQDSIDTASR